MRTTCRSSSINILLSINQYNILCQRRRSKMNTPSIPFLPSDSRNVMFRVPPNLFCRPILTSLRFIRDSTRPEHTLDIGEWSRFDVRGPSLFEEWIGDFRERFTFCCDENCSEYMIAMFKVFGGEMINSGGSYIYQL